MAVVPPCTHLKRDQPTIRTQVQETNPPSVHRCKRPTHHQYTGARDQPTISTQVQETNPPSVHRCKRPTHHQYTGARPTHHQYTGARDQPTISTQVQETNPPSVHRCKGPTHHQYTGANITTCSVIYNRGHSWHSRVCCYVALTHGNRPSSTRWPVSRGKLAVSLSTQGLI